MAQFYRKMSFHFPRVFSPISDRSVWHPSSIHEVGHSIFITHPWGWVILLYSRHCHTFKSELFFFLLSKSRNYTGTVDHTFKFCTHRAKIVITMYIETKTSQTSVFVFVSIQNITSTGNMWIFKKAMKFNWISKESQCTNWQRSFHMMAFKNTNWPMSAYYLSKRVRDSRPWVWDSHAWAWVSKLLSRRTQFTRFLDGSIFHAKRGKRPSGQG